MAERAFPAPPPGFEGWARWPGNSGSLQKKSTERVLFFFVYSLLLSTDLPVPLAGALWGLRPPSLCRRPPRARPCTRDREALSAARAHTWCQGVPTDQLDPGLNKDKCVWIRNPRCVLLFPPCSRLCVPTGGPSLALGLGSGLRHVRPARVGSPGPDLGRPGFRSHGQCGFRMA